MGRTGRVTPFALLEPVFVAGSTVSMATLHNQDQVKAKDVRPGDLVIVRKAGDVIPEVVARCARPRRPECRKPPWKFPTTCPDCGTPLVRLGESDTYCTNPDCPAQRFNRSCTSRHAGPWTSRASASSASPNWSAPDSSVTSPISTT